MLFIPVSERLIPSFVTKAIIWGYQFFTQDIMTRLSIIY